MKSNIYIDQAEAEMIQEHTHELNLDDKEDNEIIRFESLATKITKLLSTMPNQSN